MGAWTPPLRHLITDQIPLHTKCKTNYTRRYFLQPHMQAEGYNSSVSGYMPIGRFEAATPTGNTALQQRIAPAVQKNKYYSSEKYMNCVFIANPPPPPLPPLCHYCYDYVSNHVDLWRAVNLFRSNYQCCILHAYMHTCTRRYAQDHM